MFTDGKQVRKQMFPQARKDDLLIQDVADEVLIYDLKTDKAHCLNRAAATVWRHCNGKNTIAQLASHLNRELNLTNSNELVSLALNDLKRAHLLCEPFSVHSKKAGYTRRELARRVGLAGVALLPAVISIVAPTALEAAGSCVPPGQCSANPRGNAAKCCCSANRRCNGTTGNCEGPTC
jgi:coenzyme PQQ synthesis protein D (PqqD)